MSKTIRTKTSVKKLTDAQQAWVNRSILSRPQSVTAAGSWWTQAAGVGERETFVELQRKRQTDARWGSGYRGRELHMTGKE